MSVTSAKSRWIAWPLDIEKCHLDNIRFEVNPASDVPHNRSLSSLLIHFISLQFLDSDMHILSLALGFLAAFPIVKVSDDFITYCEHISTLAWRNNRISGIVNAFLHRPLMNLFQP